MVINKTTPKRGEALFVLAAALAAAACVALAVLFAAPLAPNAASEASTISFEQAARVNLNTASIEVLCTLPNVGESRARAIVEYRVQNRFNSVSEAANVPGLTQEIVDSWDGLAYVSKGWP